MTFPGGSYRGGRGGGNPPLGEGAYPQSEQSVMKFFAQVPGGTQQQRPATQPPQYARTQPMNTLPPAHGRGGFDNRSAVPQYNTQQGRGRGGYQQGGDRQQDFQPVRREKLQEGGQLNVNARKDYDAIVRSFAENETLTELEFPSTLTPTERHHCHKLAMHFNLDHKSSGPANARVLKLFKKNTIAPTAPSDAKGDKEANSFKFLSEIVSSNERKKTVDMFQGAQLLNSEFFSEVCNDVGKIVQPLHSNVVRTIRSHALHEKQGRRFRHAEPGLSTPPANTTDPNRTRELQNFREKLPTMKIQSRIVDAVRNNSVVVISGDTGCGKTTQIPQMLYDSGIFSKDEHIICTQPRRISALSVAQRVASERGQPCGGDTGYIIRFENQTSPATRIVYCTTGILLRRLHSDPSLRGVSCVVVDEVHERDVDTDFALLLLKEVLLTQPKRNLKIVVMSATIQIDRLVEYFTAANGRRKPPLIAIPGTLFKVEEYWLDDALQWLNLPATAAPAMLLEAEQSRANAQRQRTADDAATAGTAYHLIKEQVLTEFDKDQETVIPYDVITQLIQMYDRQCGADKSGGILVFLPGWGPIDRVANAIRRLGGKFAVHMLHSSISAADQARVFFPPPRGFRKVVLSTNVAETSVTIDDITFVIDSGLLKGTAYDVAGNTSSLKSQLISKANGIQRRGRAGRCRAGLCVHLLPRATYHRLPDFLPPEILRTSLEEICLQIKAVKSDVPCVDVLAEALDSPPRNAILYAVEFLKDLGALDPREQLTNLGRALASLPIHPLLGKMLLLASCSGVLEPISIIAASLSSKSPFVKPMPHQIDQLNEIRGELDQDELSDHLTVLKLFHEWRQLRSPAAQQDFAMRHMADHSTLRSIERTAQQLIRLVQHSGFLRKIGKVENALGFASRHQTNTGLVRMVLLWSMMPRVAVMEKHKTRSKGELFCWDGKPCQVHNSSVLFKKKQQCFKGREFVLYYERMRVESQLQMFDATAVSRISFLLAAKNVQVYPMTSISVAHGLDDEVSKFGPLDGVKQFPSAYKMFTGLPGDKLTESTFAEESNIAEAPPAAIAQRPEEEEETPAPLIRFSERRDATQWSALMIDRGIKCFVVPNAEAGTIRALRECMDFYFSLAMMHVDAAEFPEELVSAIGLAIGYPARREPKTAPGSIVPTRDATAAKNVVESGSAQAATTGGKIAAVATWMTAAYSDDDADEKLLGGEKSDDDEGVVVLEELVDLVKTKERLSALYDCYGDLAILRRLQEAPEAPLFVSLAAEPTPQRVDSSTPEPTPQRVDSSTPEPTPMTTVCCVPLPSAPTFADPCCLNKPLPSISPPTNDEDDGDDDVIVFQPGQAF